MSQSWQFTLSSAVLMVVAWMALQSLTVQAYYLRNEDDDYYQQTDSSWSFTPINVDRRTVHNIPGRGHLDSRVSNLRPNKCEMNQQIRELCERCAKYTRNHKVFSLCCWGGETYSGPESTKSILEWCQEFMGYRLETKRSKLYSPEDHSDGDKWPLYSDE